MLYSSNLVTSKPFERSPVKMFLSSRQAGYSNRQQRPKAAASRAGGPRMLGGSRGMLPQKVLKILPSNGCIWCIIG